MSKEVHEGECEFIFPNKDKYTGHYGAHVSGLAWREGAGAYATHDGQIYKGNWKDDKLNESENVQITFQNKDQYRGRIQKYKYNGPGTYSFGSLSHLTCNYANNKPSGRIIYIDCYGQFWYGKAEMESALLAREHVFSYELDSERGKGVPKYKPKILAVPESVDTEESEEESVDPREEEKVIFFKSFKTASHISTEESAWYRDYERFEETRKNILNKLTTHGPSTLMDEEKLWYKHYCKSAKILQHHKVKQLKKPYNDLLKQYFEEQLKDTCPPLAVFYPRQALDGQ